MKKILKTIIPILVLFFAGCAKHTNVLVNSFANTESNKHCFAINSSFKIIPIVKEPSLKNNVLENNDLLSKEITRKIEIMLENRGFKIDESPNADHILLYCCSMNSRIVKVNVPIYIPGDSSYTYGSVNGPFTQAYQQNYYYTETTTGPGRYEIIPTQYTIYDKKLEILIAKTYEPKSSIWNAVSLSSNKNGDFRNDINYLIKGAFNYFGISSKKIINAKINLDDKEIKDLQNNGKLTIKPVSY